MHKKLIKNLFYKLPFILQKIIYNLYYYSSKPKDFIKLLRKKSWLKKYRSFDQKNRELFFLRVTSFLWTNRSEQLFTGYYMEFGCFGCKTMSMCWKHTRHFFDLEYLAFDSFEGLPEITKIDEQPIWKKGRLSMSEMILKNLFLKMVCQKVG